MNITKYYKSNIAGHEFDVIEFPSGYITFGAPFGDNEYDKQMFDSFVYHNQRVYNGETRDKKQIVQNIEKWIANYKIINKTMNKYKVEFFEKNYYVIDVLAETEEKAKERAEIKLGIALKNGTYHYYESRDPEVEVDTVYDVTNTDDPFNP